MKIALYIEDGLEQIVLTPEGETEKAILAKIHDGSRELAIRRGTFYPCRGGWMRWDDHGREDSTMLVLRAKQAGEPVDCVVIGAPHNSPIACGDRVTMGVSEGVSSGEGTSETAENWHL